MHDSIQFNAFKQCLRFVYTGEINFNADVDDHFLPGSMTSFPGTNEEKTMLHEMKLLSDKLDMPIVREYVSNLESGDDLSKVLNESLKSYYLHQLGTKMGSAGIFDADHSDVCILLEDNKDMSTLHLSLHNSLLSCRSEYWDIMLNGQFQESNLENIKVQINDEFRPFETDPDAHRNWLLLILFLCVTIFYSLTIAILILPVTTLILI
jgi:hypothetical protein